MLGILLIYWIGKYYYKLAEEFQKSKWGYAILGIAIYYFATFFFGIIAVIIAEFMDPGFIDRVNETLLGILMIPFAALSTFLLYKYLAKTWKKNRPDPEELINEFGTSEEV